MTALADATFQHWNISSDAAKQGASIPLFQNEINETWHNEQILGGTLGQQTTDLIHLQAEEQNDTEQERMAESACLLLYTSVWTEMLCEK